MAEEPPSDDDTIANSKYDFVSDDPAFRKWLLDMPHFYARITAVRSALRVFPLTLEWVTHARDEIELDYRKSVLLNTFRSIFIAIENLPSKRSEDVSSFAQDAASALRELLPAKHNINESTQYSWAAHAAADAAERKQPEFLILSFGDAATAIQLNNEDAPKPRPVIPDRNQFYEATKLDLFFLDHALKNNENILDVLQVPLWGLIHTWVRRHDIDNSNIPDWAESSLSRFSDFCVGKNEDWRVILEWYQQFLSTTDYQAVREVYSDKFSLSIATHGPIFWERGSDEVISNIAQSLSQRLSSISEPMSEAEAKAPQKGNLSANISIGLGMQADLQDANSSPNEIKNERQSNTPILTGSVNSHPDNPVDEDLLDRRFFARAIVDRMDDIRARDSEDGFAIQLHAPWGAGKTSVMRIMEKIMTNKMRKKKDRWICVHFNAWEYESRKPPWWPLLKAIKEQCGNYLVGSYNNLRFERLACRWWVWKIKTDWFPFVASALVFILAGLAIVEPYFSQDSHNNGIENPSPLKHFDLVLSAIASVAAVISAFVIAGRIFVFGTPKNAETYFRLSQDPLKGIKNLFTSILRITDQPVCVFIDDLDRCQPEYVVELLSGVQTAFRDKNVTYIVAADRRWIRESFEAEYGRFAESLGNSEQPLGFLFLEKLFQVSIGLPAVSDEVLARYWNHLLTGEIQGSQDAEYPLEQAIAEEKEDPKLDALSSFSTEEQVLSAARKKIRQRFGSNLTRELAKEELENEDDPLIREAFAHEVSKSRRSEKQALHLLSPYVKIVSDNPRVMKDEC